MEIKLVAICLAPLTQVTFTCGSKIILNRQNFEWNKSPFNEEFRNSSNASEFISIWQNTTNLDARKQQAVPVDEVVLPSSESSQTSSCVHGDNSESPSIQPASKRMCIQAERSSGNSSLDQTQIHSNPIDDAILSKRIGKQFLMLCSEIIIACFCVHIGLFRLPVTNLIQPQSDLRLIRKLDVTFVNNLKKRIQDNPSGPGVPPIAVLCINVEKENFAERYKDSYRYEVLGGQHTVAAKTELLRENPSNSLFNQVFAEVYIGLSDKESLRLASRHNSNGHFIHRMGHKDYVSYSCIYVYS